MKEFTTAVQEAAREDDNQDAYEFLVDGVLCRCFKPGDGQLSVLMAMTSRLSDEREQVAGIINFFASVLDTPSNVYIVTRLLDRKDDFGLVQIQGIMEWMVEEWTGNPTAGRSVSTQLPQSGGPRSTPTTPVLTSSDSLPTGS